MIRRVPQAWPVGKPGATLPLVSHCVIVNAPMYDWWSLASVMVPLMLAGPRKWCWRNRDQAAEARPGREWHSPVVSARQSALETARSIAADFRMACGGSAAPRRPMAMR